MKTNCLIPARGGSKRIPRKNLNDFCGKPLVVWSIEQALASTGIDKVYVSSEDTEILNVALTYGAEIVLRPDELAQDSSTLEEVIEHFLKEVPTDVLVVLQPTSPLRLPGDIENCIQQMAATLNSACWSVNVEDDLFLWNDEIEPYNFERDWREVSTFYRENGSIYCFTAEGFKNHQSRYAGAKCISYMQKWQSYEIDEPEDVRVCEALMKEFILNEKEVVL